MSRSGVERKQEECSVTPGKYSASVSVWLGM